MHKLKLINLPYVASVRRKLKQLIIFSKCFYEKNYGEEKNNPFNFKTANLSFRGSFIVFLHSSKECDYP